MPKINPDVFDDETDDVEWETIAAGLGEEHQFDIDGPLVGNYLGSIEVEVPDQNSSDPNATRRTLVHQFAPLDDPTMVKFVWGSYSLDQALGTDENGNRFVPLGAKVRVIYRGKREIRGGKQSIRQYTVQVAK